MAYKFQIGEARLSGSIIAEEGLTADASSNLIASGSDSEIKLIHDDASTNLFLVDVQTQGGDEFGRLTLKDDTSGGTTYFIVSSGSISASVDLDIGGDMLFNHNKSIGVGTDTDLITLNENEVAVRGTLKTDSISSNNSSAGLDIDASSVDSAAFNVLMSHNLADAFNIKSGSDSFIQFVTTAGSPKIVFGQTAEFSSISSSGPITASNFYAAGAGAFGSVTTDTTINAGTTVVAGTTVSGAGQLQGASVAVDGAVVASDFDVPTGGNVTLFDTVGGANLTLGASNTEVIVAGNLTVQGTTTTIESANFIVTSSIFFEGLIPDNNEIKLTTAEPTTDRTITLPDLTGHVPLLADVLGSATVTAGEFSVLAGGSTISSSVTVASGDGILFNDGGTLMQIDVDNIATFVGSSGARSTGYNLRSLDLNTIPDGGQISVTPSSDGTGLYGTESDHTASFTIGLSGSWSSGDVVIVKSNASGSDFPITIIPSGSNVVIDGADQIVLESTFAAVTLVYDGNSAWQII